MSVCEGCRYVVARAKTGVANVGKERLVQSMDEKCDATKSPGEERVWVEWSL